MVVKFQTRFTNPETGTSFDLDRYFNIIRRRFDIDTNDDNDALHYYFAILTNGADKSYTVFEGNLEDIVNKLIVNLSIFYQKPFNITYHNFEENNLSVRDKISEMLNERYQ